MRDHRAKTGRRLVLLALTVTLLAGCGPRLQVSHKSTATLPETPPGAGQARVVFVRPPQVSGQYGVSVWADGELVAFVRSAQKMYVDLPAGLYVMLAVAGGSDVLEADLEAGRTYFIHVRMVSYYMGSSVFIDPLYPGHENWHHLQDWLDKTTLFTLNPPDADEWTRRHARDNESRMNRYENRPPADRKHLRREHGI